MFRLNIISTLRSVFAPLSHTHDDKVDKVTGKGLSTNDYTTDEKNKLAGIAAGANKTVVDSALSSSSANPVQNSVINTALGNKVDKVSGKGLSTNDFTGTYKTALDNLNTTIATAVGNLEMIEVVTSLPTSNIKNNKLYLKANSVSGSENKYDIYVRVNNAWEKVDSLDFSISDYIKKDSNTNLLLSNGTTKAQSSFIANSTGSVNSAHITNYAIDFTKTQEFDATGGASTGGYVKVMQITVAGAWKDMPITFDIFSRSKEVSHATLIFQNNSGSDPGINSFTYTGAENEIFIVKNTTSKWDVVVKKPANDKIVIKNVQQPHSYVSYGVTFAKLDVLLDSAPTLASTDKQATYKGFSSAEKTKLAGIDTGANKITVDSALSSSSTNPVQNKVINTALGNKVDIVSGKGLSTNDYTTNEKNKLAGITESADAVTYSQTVASSTSGAYEVGKITINGTATTIYGKDTNTTYSAVGTTGNAGLMTAADKVKLNGITESADAVSYSQTSGSSVSGVYEIGKITINGTATTIYGKDTNTTYSDVVAGGSSGLMTGSDKTKLNNVATGATKTSFSYTNGVLTINNE